MSTIQKIESGTRKMNIETLAVISSQLNVTTDFVVFGETKKEDGNLFPNLNKFFSILNNENLEIIEYFVNCVEKDIVLNQYLNQNK